MNGKRIFDIVLAIVLGIVFAPLMIVISLAVKFTSPGPVIFNQKRLGKNGEIFQIKKFRKFPDDLKDSGLDVTLMYDPRMTKIGRFLERTKLDELPQLWNILVGEMTFVGPRPETLKFRHLFEEKYTQVLDFIPGIFGPNQTKFRNESAMYPEDGDPEEFYRKVLFPQKADADLEYFPTSNLLTDIKWILSGSFSLVASAVLWRKISSSTLLLAAMDVVAVCLGWATTLLLRFGSFEEEKVITMLKEGLILIPLSVLLVFSMTRVYRNPPRFFSETDFYRLVGSTSVAWIVIAILMGIVFDSTTSLKLAVACLVSIGMLAVPRILYQLYFKRLEPNARRRKVDEQRVVVCGISQRSIELANLLSLGFRNVKVLGLISFDHSMVRNEIHGFEVLGTLNDLDSLESRYRINQVWLASDQSPPVMAQLRSWCRDNTIEFCNLLEMQGFRDLTGTRLEKPQADVVAAIKKPIAERIEPGSREENLADESA